MKKDRNCRGSLRSSGLGLSVYRRQIGFYLEINPVERMIAPFLPVCGVEPGGEGFAFTNFVRGQYFSIWAIGNSFL